MESPYFNVDGVFDSFKFIQELNDSARMNLDALPNKWRTLSPKTILSTRFDPPIMKRGGLIKLEIDWIKKNELNFTIGDLCVVGEGEPYHLLSMERGGDFLPWAMAKTFERMMNKAVFGLIANNEDFKNLPLFHPKRRNVLFKELNFDSFCKARAMIVNNLDVNPIKYLLLIPIELEICAKLMKDAAALKELGILTIETNDSENWFLMVDPKERQTVRFQFLDIFARPRIFVEDVSPKTTDIILKIRQIFGVETLDWRTAIGSFPR